MRILCSLLALTGFAISIIPPAACGAPGDLDVPYNPTVNNGPVSVTYRPDGRTLIGGQFTLVGGVSKTFIAQLNGNGALDTTFTTTINDQLFCGAAQDDGKMVIGGEFTQVNGGAGFKLARLLATGGPEAGFNPTASLAVYSLAIQPDGKIIVAGNFNTLTGVNQFKIARLNANGTLDAAFNPLVLAQVWSAALQDDGKIVIGGNFDTVNGVARNFIARLNTDGTLDAAFNPNANGPVYAVSVQGDGRIVIGGDFTTVGGTTRNRVARVSATGVLDATFNPNANDIVESISAQTDGKVIIGGFFTTVGGASQRSIARLTTTGARDTTFVGTTNAVVESVTLQPDGKVLVGGNFGTISGVSRSAFARLLNDPATSALAVPLPTRVQWLRGGASPETQVVSFDLSTDGGGTWTPLGAGVRIAGGWERTGLNLPASGQVRARARVAGGRFNGSNSLTETITAFTFPPPVVVTGAASAITTTGAVIAGTVNANGSIATVTFDYGLTDTYGQSGPASPATVSGTTAQAVTRTLQNLTPGTTYHYRVSAVNAGGTSPGVDATFTTTNLPPSGGAFSLAPSLSVAPGVAATLSASGWTDPNVPLTYQFFLDGASLGAPTSSATATFNAPTSLGTHGAALRVFDSRGDFTEVPLAFSVAADQPPMAGSMNVVRHPMQPVKIPVATILGAATDPDPGDTISLVSVANGTNGTAQIVGNFVLYTPTGNFPATHTFPYTIQDNHGTTANGSVTVTVIVDNAPGQNITKVTVQGNGSVAVDFAGIPGYTYGLQFTPDLIAPWVTLGPVTTNAVGAGHAVDGPPPVGATSGFYRLVFPYVPPAPP